MSDSEKQPEEKPAEEVQVEKKIIGKNESIFSVTIFTRRSEGNVDRVVSFLSEHASLLWLD